MSFRSLRTRIFLLILLVGIVPSVLMRYGIVRNYEQRAVEQRTATVQNQLKIIANHLVSNGYFENKRINGQELNNSKAVINAELETIASLYEGRVMVINKNFKVEKDTYDISEGKTVISEEVINCFQGKNKSHYDTEHGYIEMTTAIEETAVDSGLSDKFVGKNSTGEIIGVMITSVSNESIIATMETLNRKALILEVLMIVVIFALAFILSFAMTKPLDRVTQAISQVKDGFRNDEISVPDYVETVHIIDAFNQLLSRMKTIDESRQEFVANVSHELKTPMTSIKVLAESLLMQENTPAELYREFMEDMVTEIDRENQIITDLLSLVKLDKKVQDLNISTINVNELTELVLKRLRPIARKKDVEIVFESMRMVSAEVDEVKLSIILTNLVENAIKYNLEHGRVRVTLDADHQNFTFVVNDNGIGIPEEALAQIFERFYRVDKSHSREIGGTGLGLAITRSAVLAHKGTITVESTLGAGTAFTIKIPLNYIVE